MSQEAALVRLAEDAAQAVPQTLAAYGIEDVVVGRPTVLAQGVHPLSSLPVPGVATSGAFAGGVMGGNLLGVSLRAARLLAAAMMGQDPTAVPDDAAELSELEQSAVADAGSQIVAAAAAATSAMLGTEIEVGALETRSLAEPGDAETAFATSAPHAVVTPIRLFGEPLRLVQLVPNPFLVRMTHALDALGVETVPDPAAAAEPSPLLSPAIGSALLDSRLRVWAEVGRARLPAGRVVELPPGAVVELDRGAEDPVDLFVNGHPYATGRLVVDDGGEWAVRIDTILDRPQPRVGSSPTP